MSGGGTKDSRTVPSHARPHRPATRHLKGRFCGPGVIIECESSTLSDVRTGIETRYYVTDLAPVDANTEHLFGLTKGHWSIESLHWVRDVTFDEDRSQVRTGALPRILVTLRNLAIGIIRHTAYRSVNIAAATRQLARQPDVTLDILGIPPLLCK
jgi:hypothetical protein